MKTFRLFYCVLNLLWMVLTARVVIIILAVLIPLLYWYGAGEAFPIGNMQKPPSSRQVEDAAGEVARSIVLQCPQPEKTYSQLLVLPVRNDRENAVENMVRREFQQQADSGWYKLVEKNTMTQAFDQLQLAVFGKDGQKELTKDDAIRLGKAAGAELVLLSQVDRFVPSNGGHEIRGTSQLINIATGETRQISFDNFSNHDIMKHSGLLWQFAVLMIFTLVWPIFMIPVLRGVVARENNRDNLAAMIVMAAIPLGIIMLWVGKLPNSAFDWMCYCIFFALAVGWVGFVMNKLAEK